MRQQGERDLIYIIYVLIYLNWLKAKYEGQTPENHQQCSPGRRINSHSKKKNTTA